MSGTTEKKATAPEIRVTPTTETITRAPGLSIERFPIADIYDNGTIIPHGGTYALVSATPHPPGLVVRTNPGTRMNGYLQFKLTSSTRIITEFTPHPPYSHLKGRYTLSITMSRDAAEDDSDVEWAKEEHYNRV